MGIVAALPQAARAQETAPPATPAQSAPAPQQGGQTQAAPATQNNAPAIDANGDYILPQDNAPQPAATPATLDQASEQALANLKDGGTIRGHVTAGAQNGKGGVALPGVAITATNSLTGDKYSTVTDITGGYGLAIPKNGRYVVRAELAAFAAGTKEIVLNAQSRQGVADIGMELASRVQDTGAGGSQFAGAMNFGGRGTQSLGLSNAASGAIAAGFGGQQEGASLPSIGGADSADSVAVSGATGSTSASFNFEQARQGFEDQRALQGATESRGSGGGFGPGGPGGNMGFAMGGPPPGGGGRSMFRNFKPNQPHGSLVFQETNSALNAQDYSLDGTQQAQPSYGSERYGAVYVGPVIPGLLTSTKNFLFLSAFGNHGSTPFDQYGIVPTAEERAGLIPSGAVTNPLGYPTVSCSGSTSGNCVQFPVTPFAAAYLQGASPAIPLPNQPADSSNRNYRLLTSEASNTDTVGARFVRNFGSAGGGGMPLPPWMRNGQSNNSLTQNLNANFNYSHTGSDLLTLFPDFRGKQQIHQVSGTIGYTVGKGPWLWNFSSNINRSVTETTNPFTYVNNVAGNLGVQGAGQVPFFYGLPSVNFATVSSASETQPANRTNQVLTLSDSTSWTKGNNNVRFGGDVKRIDLNAQGGVNGTGAFTFTGFATGSDLGDFLLGYPQIANLQSGGVNDVQKFYFRANVFDAFAQDTWKASPTVTVLAGLRYEYYSPYSEKFDHIANLDPNAGFTGVDVVLPYQTGAYNGTYPRSLVNPSPYNFAPRFGLAWKALKNTVVRTGYGINYNTAQYGAFIQRLGYQPPFATAVNNAQSTPGFTVYNGLTADASQNTCTVTPCITNNYAVDKNYRLGYVQVYNLDIQQTFPKGFVLNVGYNGSKGTHLDGLLAPNYVLNVGASTPNAEVFNYEVSSGISNFNALAVRLRKRYQNNLSVGVTYTYSHSIDDASSVGAATQVVAQLPQSLAGDRGNSSFDQRHVAVGDWLYELPFGPNQHYLSGGNWASHALAGLQWSGNFTFSTGTPLNPYYAASVAQAAAGVSGSLRPDRVPGVSLESPSGDSQLNQWFNTAAFSEPCGNKADAAACHFGDAARYSIFGPGTTDVDMAFSKVVQFGDTKSLEFRAQGTNIFNIVQYATVDSNLTSETAGHVLSTRAMRQFVVLARFRF